MQRAFILQDAHGNMNNVTVYMDILALQSNILQGLYFIIIRESIIPERTRFEICSTVGAANQIRTPLVSIAPKYALTSSYNVSFYIGCPPASLPILERGKPFKKENRCCFPLRLSKKPYRHSRNITNNLSYSTRVGTATP